MTKKLKILIATNLFLILAIITTIALNGRKISFQNEDLPDFSLLDSANTDKLVFGKIVLKRQFGANWTINDSIQADNFMIEQLLMMLQKTTIKRSLTDKSQAEMAAKITQKGTKIEFFAGNTLQKSFMILGEENETFAQIVALNNNDLAKNEQKNQKPYVIHTPAYKAVLHEIFTLPEKEWRNRSLISVGWNSLQYLELSYNQKPEQSFSIIFDSLLYKESNQIFYKMQGIKQLDSVMLFNYIKAFNNVRVAKYLDNKNLRDSLQKIPPYCTIKIDDLSPKQRNTLRLYPTANKMFAIVEKTNELVLFDMRYISGLLVRKKDFEKL